MRLVHLRLNFRRKFVRGLFEGVEVEIEFLRGVEWKIKSVVGALWKINEAMNNY